MASSRRSSKTAPGGGAAPPPARIDARPAGSCPICGAPVERTPKGVLLTRCVAGHSWWQPNPGPQTRFLASSASEVLYGGAAGGGKSAASITTPLRWVHHPAFRSLILRRESTQLGDLLDKAASLYDKVYPGAHFNEVKKTWFFPSGATIRFNHCQLESDAKIYDGFEFQHIGFDELTHFTETQYRTIRARIRGPHADLPRITRSTTNPGGPGHEWVLQRWGPWLNPKYELPGRAPRFNQFGDRLPPADGGEVLYYVTGERGEDVWVDKGATDIEGNQAKSRTFIPARLEDNPQLLANDPGYAASLRDLDPVRRAQLRDGNWLVKPSRGLFFKREYFADKFVDAAPAEVLARVRYWDRAATQGGGDWTVGALVSKTPDGLIWVEHAARAQLDPGGVEALLRTTANTDGHGVIQCLEQDPGQAGKVEIAYLFRALAGFPVAAFPKRVNKIVSAGPFSAQCSAGNVRIVRGAWNDAFLATLYDFPDGDHDDDVDAAGGAYNVLMGAQPVSDDDERLIITNISRR